MNALLMALSSYWEVIIEVRLSLVGSSTTNVLFGFLVAVLMLETEVVHLLYPV